MWVPVTDFGFVRPAVARDLVATIARAARAVRRAASGPVGGVRTRRRGRSLRLGRAEGRRRLGRGDRGISREVVAVVEPLGFYCDRRQFRSRIPLAAVNDLTTVEHLEIVIAALDTHVSETWTVDEMLILQRGAGTVSPGGHRSRARGLRSPRWGGRGSNPRPMDCRDCTSCGEVIRAGCGSITTIPLCSGASRETSMTTTLGARTGGRALGRGDLQLHLPERDGGRRRLGAARGTPGRSDAAAPANRSWRPRRPCSPSCRGAGGARTRDPGIMSPLL